MNIKNIHHNSRRIGLLAFCMLMLLIASCRKEEFMPVPEGEIIPAEEATLNLKETLNATSYTLFSAAWARSTMDAKLEAYGARSKFTLLVPTDEAFIAAGMTLEVINSTTAEALDELLMYHTIAGEVDPAGLEARQDNSGERSILANPDLRVKPLSPNNPYTSDPYFYRQYLKVQEQQLYINGKDAGKVSPVRATNGILWPINRVLQKPTKTMLEVLQEDGRFGIYLEVWQRNADRWLEVSEYSFMRDLGYSGFSIISTYPGDPSPNIIFGSLMAPTDAAFHAADFADADAVVALNDQRPLPYLDYNTYTMVGAFASDSLLTLHHWSDVVYPSHPETGATGVATATTFYSNDLNNGLLSDYVLRTEVANINGNLPSMVMPLDFGKNAAGAVTVKAKGSTHPAAVVIESDINTLMGPIHVVDHLIPPANFKY